MTLQSSGPISFQNLETEFGGSHPITMTEYYGRDFGIPASGTISMSQFYGKSSALETHTLTMGASTTGGNYDNSDPPNYNPLINYFGYQGYFFGSLGSISPDTSSIYSYLGNAKFTALFSEEDEYSSFGQRLYLEIATFSGSPPPNSGWSTISIRNTNAVNNPTNKISTFNRTDASFYQGTAANQVAAEWIWNSSPLGNAFAPGGVGDNFEIRIMA
jgi:hypothetical protein